MTRLMITVALIATIASPVHALERKVDLCAEILEQHIIKGLNHTLAAFNDKSILPG